MFNLKNTNDMNYSFNNLFDDILKDSLYTPTMPHRNEGHYSINKTKEGLMELMVNVAGHNPKDVELNATENELHIKATAEKVNAVIGNVNLKFTVGKDYDGTSSEATIENGILTIALDKKEEQKGKRVKIKF